MQQINNEQLIKYQTHFSTHYMQYLLPTVLSTISTWLLLLHFGFLGKQRNLHKTKSNYKQKHRLTKDNAYRQDVGSLY